MDQHSGLVVAAGGPAVRGPRAKVLLVDDHRDKRLAIGAIIEDLDVDVLEAGSGAEALRLVLANDFAVILMDVSMPIMDGFETAGLIRQRKHSRHTPIIFVTAFSDTEAHASRGYSLGAVDFIFAPVVPEALRSKVSVFIELFAKNREIERQGELLRSFAERRVVVLESRLDRLLNRLNVGVFRLSPEGVLISANPSFFRIFGIDPAAPPDSIDFAALYLHDGSTLAARMQGGQLHEYHARERHLDGSPIWISLSKALVVDSDGGQHIDGLVEDISSRKLSEGALIAKAEELARSNAELEEFAFIASHDLQEPLRTVSSYASLIALRYGDQLDDKGRMFLDHLVNGARSMQDLIRDILDYAKIGKLPTWIAVDCEVVIGRVVFSLQQIITASGAVVTWDPLPSFTGDPVLLAQVFQNLIGNALKFRHPDRPPVVHVAVSRVGAFWAFTVTDNGIGIAPQFYEKIFSIFQRLHTKDLYPGTGIGLAICRKAIQQLGGTIAVESDPGRGSVFRFLLPAGENAPASQLPTAPPTITV